jgi:hypothetical protein
MKGVNGLGLLKLKRQEAGMKILFKASDFLKKKLPLCQKEQSTLEYAMVMVIAGIISVILVPVGNRKILRKFAFGRLF